jgi:hypothetical protein
MSRSEAEPLGSAQPLDDPPSSSDKWASSTGHGLAFQYPERITSLILDFIDGER